MRNIQTYTTSPVAKLGFVETVETYRSNGLLGPIVGYTLELDDIKEAFDLLVTIKHNQRTLLRDGLLITALASGHTLGGNIWLFDMNTEKIIYAPVWNHSKDLFIEGTRMLQENGNPLPMLSRPLVMISLAMVGSSLSYNKRVEKFLALVDATLQNLGTVFLPVSLGLRFLELVHIVDNHLRALPYQVYLLAHTGTRALAEAGSSLEWMLPAVTREWQLRSKMPFEALTVTVIEPAELDRLAGLKIVFCAGAALEPGLPAFDAFSRVCGEQTTTVILTERAEPGTLAHDLYEFWERAAINRAGKAEDGVAVPYRSNINSLLLREEALHGHDLESFKESVEKKREEEKERKQRWRKQQYELNAKRLRQNGEAVPDDMDLLTALGKILEDDDDDDDDDGKEEEEGADGNSRKRKEDDLRENLPLDIDVRSAKGKNSMFPYYPKKAKYDDYGETINAKDYVIEDAPFDHKNLERERKFEGLSKINNMKRFKEETYDEFADLLVLSHPRKRVSRATTLRAECGLVYVDLAGLVDPRSLLLIVSGLKPRNFLLFGDTTNPSNMESVYKQLSHVNTKRGGVMKNGRFVNKQFELVKVENNKEVSVSESFTTFEVLLDESIADTLKWQKISGGYSIAQVVGEIVDRKELEAEEEKDVKKKENEVDHKDNEDKKDEGTLKAFGIGLKALPESMSQLINVRHAQLAIGDIRLKELKDLYGGDYHTAEFKGEGTLVIDDKICVRKVSEGDFVVEGTPCDLFYDVREKVKGMLAYV